MKVKKLLLLMLFPLFIFTLIGCNTSGKGEIDEKKLRQANDEQRKEFADEYTTEKLEKSQRLEVKGSLKINTKKSNITVDVEGITDTNTNSQFDFSIKGKDSTNFDIESNITITTQEKNNVYVRANSRKKDGTYYEFQHKIVNPGNGILPNPTDMLDLFKGANFSELAKQLGNDIEFLKDNNNPDITYLKLKHKALEKLLGGSTGVDAKSYVIIGIKKINNKFQFASAIIKMTKTINEQGMKIETDYTIKQTTAEVPRISESDKASYSEINSTMDFLNKLPFKLLG